MGDSCPFGHLNKRGRHEDGHGPSTKVGSLTLLGNRQWGEPSLTKLVTLDLGCQNSQ